MAVFLLIAVQFVPESPRFLIAKGRDQEALNFLIDYHGNGDRDDQLVAFEYNEICVAIRLEQEAKAEKWGTILKSRSNRHRLGLAALMIFCTNLSGSSIIYFYYVTVFELVGITDPTTQTGINAGLTIFTWFCQIAAVYAGKRVGRKTIILWVWPMILLGLVGLCVSGGIFAQADDGNTQAGVATVVLVWLYLGAFNFSSESLTAGSSGTNQTDVLDYRSGLVFLPCRSTDVLDAVQGALGVEHDLELGVRVCGLRGRDCSGQHWSVLRISVCRA